MNKVEDVRLMESRKSARLQQDSSEFHHHQLQYVRPIASPNVISHVSSSMIDVPESLLRNRFVLCNELNTIECCYIQTHIRFVYV